MTQCATVTALPTGPRTSEKHLQLTVTTKGSCVDSPDAETWFPATATPDDAKKACAGCPVRAECLELALHRDEKHGIWGGTTPEERLLMRRRTLRAARQAVA